MSTLNIQTIEPLGMAPYYTGLQVSGMATADEKVTVHYEIAANGVCTSNLYAQAADSGQWSVKFNGEFSAGTEVTVIAQLDDGATVSKNQTLPLPSETD